MTRPLSGPSSEGPKLEEPPLVKTPIDSDTDDPQSDNIAGSNGSWRLQSVGNTDQTTEMINEVQALGLHYSTLEKLPAELRIRILSSVPDLQTLRAAIHASPIYFAQYRLNRKSILAQALQSELGDELFLDVYAAFKSRSSKIGPRRVPNSNVTDFLTMYRGWRTQGGERPTPGMFSLDDLRWMTWFHTQTVQPLTAQFVTWALNSSSAGPTRAASIFSDTGHGDISSTEKTRLLRAFYRYETFCHLFGGSQYQSSRLRGSDMSRLFFSELNPWEVEEICCVYKFVEERYEQIIVEVRWDFDPENPKFDDDLDLEPEGSVDFNGDYDGTPNFYSPPLTFLAS